MIIFSSQGCKPSLAGERKVEDKHIRRPQKWELCELCQGDVDAYYSFFGGTDQPMVFYKVQFALGEIEYHSEETLDQALQDGGIILACTII